MLVAPFVSKKKLLVGHCGSYRNLVFYSYSTDLSDSQNSSNSKTQ